MSIRRWFRERMGEGGQRTEDPPPAPALLDAMLGPADERSRWLGEYSSTTYPADLQELLLRREAVARELLEIDLATAQGRIESIPGLRDLLRRYPHPLVYEALINAYLDAGRYDEAKGVVFAARQRRQECARSDYPEVRSEIAYLKDWKLEEIETLRKG